MAEKKIKEMEFLLQDIAMYDDYAKGKLEEMNIQI